MKNRLIWIMAAVLSLTACSEQDNPNSDPDEPGKKDYAERLVPVVDPQGKAQGMVTLRFYDDMPNVAYVSIGNFQGIVYPGTTVQVAKTAPDRYLLTSPCGTATVDTANDRFESDDYEAFTNMMGLVQPGMPNTIFDALPMLRWKSIEKTPNNVHVTLDYGKYGIDLRADDNDVYFPFATDHKRPLCRRLHACRRLQRTDGDGSAQRCLQSGRWLSCILYHTHPAGEAAG